MTPDPCPECNSTPNVHDTGMGWQCECPRCFVGDPERSYTATGFAGTGDTREQALAQWNQWAQEQREDNAA